MFLFSKRDREDSIVEKKGLSTIYLTDAFFYVFH
jgi:hypothetical protein